MAALFVCCPQLHPPRQDVVSGSILIVHNAESVQDTLELRLTMPREARTGRAVRAKARLTNVAGRPLDLYLRGRGLTIDLVAEGTNGDKAWRLLEGEVIPAIVHHRRLGPGEVLDVPLSWSWALEEGIYRVHALLLTEGNPVVSERVSVRLRP